MRKTIRKVALFMMIGRSSLWRIFFGWLRMAVWSDIRSHPRLQSEKIPDIGRYVFSTLGIQNFNPAVVRVHQKVHGNCYAGDYPQLLVPLVPSVVKSIGPKAAGRLVIGMWQESVHALNCSSSIFQMVNWAEVSHQGLGRAGWQSFHFSLCNGSSAAVHNSKEVRALHWIIAMWAITLSRLSPLLLPWWGLLDLRPVLWLKKTMVFRNHGFQNIGYAWSSYDLKKTWFQPRIHVFFFVCPMTFENQVLLF